MRESSDPLHSTTKVSPFKRWGGLALKIAVACGLIFWLSQKGFLDIGQVLSQAQSWHIALALLLTLGSISLNHWRWVVLVRGVGLPGSFQSLFPLTFMGLFFNFAMPGSVGGDLIKGYYIVKSNPQQRMVSGFSVLMDRLIGMWAMSFLALLALLLKMDLVRQKQELQLMGVAILAVFSGFIVMQFVAHFMGSPWIKTFEQRWASSKFFSLVFKLAHAFRAYQKKPHVLLGAFALSLASQSCAVGFMMLVGSVMGGMRLDVISYFFVVPLGFIAMALPVAPAGIGVGQTALFFLFNMILGEPTQLGPNAITSFQMALFLWSLIGAYYYVRHKPAVNEALHAG